MEREHEKTVVVYVSSRFLSTSFLSYCYIKLYYIIKNLLHFFLHSSSIDKEIDRFFLINLISNVKNFVFRSFNYSELRFSYDILIYTRCIVKDNLWLCLFFINALTALAQSVAINRSFNSEGSKGLVSIAC
jgi:hypothetical protein